MIRARDAIVCNHEVVRLLAGLFLWHGNFTLPIAHVAGATVFGYERLDNLWHVRRKRNVEWLGKHNEIWRNRIYLKMTDEFHSPRSSFDKWVNSIHHACAFDGVKAIDDSNCACSDCVLFPCNPAHWRGDIDVLVNEKGYNWGVVIKCYRMTAHVEWLLCLQEMLFKKKWLLLFLSI